MRLVFPVGHYLGPQYRPGNEEPSGHRVRLGPSLRWLGSEPELLAWTLAHGLGTLADDTPWTRAALVEHGWMLAELELADAVTGLLGRGLLVEVDPDGDAAPTFAAAYRLRALLLALGPDPSEPDAMLLGTAGLPVVALSEFGHAVWRAGQDAPTLWDACRTVAGAEADTDPHRLLADLLSELHGLLSTGAAYLDHAVEGESADAHVEIH